MENVKINYIGYGYMILDTKSIEDALFHLGSKFGVNCYNTGIDNGAIKVNTDNNTIDVDVDQMNQIVDNFLGIQGHLKIENFLCRKL
jgi:hypothetical protein